MAETAKKAPTKLRIGDKVFFSVDDIHVGTMMRYMGRTAPNSLWRVTRIQTFRVKSGRVYDKKDVGTVKHLHDQVYMVCTTGSYRGETISVSFGYASYSAIWRLA